MILKDADGRDDDLADLEALLLLDLSDRQRSAVEREIHNVRQGERGERDSAHYVDHFFHDSENTVVIHDLRLELENEVAQIDHLLLTRFRMAYVIETKNYGGRLYRTEGGNWKAYYGAGKGVGYDIASPTEQARRHCKSLKRWFAANGLTVFDQVEPVVMIPPDKQKPKLGGADADFTFIKADNLRLWWEESRDVGGALGSLWRVATRLSLAELERIGAGLVADHVPLQRDWRARFRVSAALVEPERATG